MTSSWHVFKGFLEFVFGAVGIFLSGIPVVDIDIVNLLAIEHHSDLCPLAGQAHGIPLAVGLGHGLGRFLGVIERADDVFAIVQAIGSDLNLETSLHGVFGIGAEEESTVPNAIKWRGPVHGTVQYGLVRVLVRVRGRWCARARTCLCPSVYVRTYLYAFVYAYVCAHARLHGFNRLVVCECGCACVVTFENNRPHPHAH